MMPTAARLTEDVARHFMDVRVFQERYDRGHNLTILNSEGLSCYIDKKPESSHFEMAARNERNQLWLSRIKRGYFVGDGISRKRHF